MTWHNTSHYIASNDVTITWPDPATDIKTSKHFTSKHKTSPPWNGRRLVHSKEMIWASRWSVALRTFYRQILSVLYSSFPFGNFRPRLVRALLVGGSCWWAAARDKSVMQTLAPSSRQKVLVRGVGHTWNCIALQKRGNVLVFHQLSCTIQEWSSVDI